MEINVKKSAKKKAQLVRWIGEVWRTGIRRLHLAVEFCAESQLTVTKGDRAGGDSSEDRHDRVIMEREKVTPRPVNGNAGQKASGLCRCPPLKNEV